MTDLLKSVTERGWLVILASAIFIYVLSLVAFVPGLGESQLFTALASGVAGAVFRDVIGMWTSSTKAGSELAQGAIDTLKAQTSSTSGGAQPAPADAKQAAGEVRDAAIDKAAEIEGAESSTKSGKG